MRPTLRTVILFGAGFPVSLLAVLASEQLWLVWACYLAVSLVLLVADAIFALPKKRLELAVNTPQTLYVGAEDPLTIEAKAPLARGNVNVELVCDFGDHLHGQAMHRLTVRADKTGSVDVPLVPRRRGTADVQRIWARWNGPLGLAQKRVVVDVNREIPVVPNIRAVRAAALRFFSRDAVHGLRVAPQVGGGSEFDALREYVPGMDHRAIDWKHSARHRKLVCKEFRAERNQQIMIAFDTGRLMTEPMAGISKLDHAINAGLLLSYISLRVG